MRMLKVLAVAACALALVAPPPALATDYPTRNITMIVPFPPGGASDTAARVVSQQLEKQLGKNIIIENKPGATGNTGARLAASAAPDGYTLLCAALSVWSINAALFKNLPYDPAKDFDHLTIAVRTPNVLVVRKDFPAKDYKEFVEYLKAHPGEVTFASSGSGSSDHLTAELWWQKTDTKANHIPYKGGGPAIADLIGGHADASFANLGNIYPQVHLGKVRALAITSEKRDPLLPEVPTLAELGLQGAEVYSWQALGGPKGMPEDVRTKLATEMVKALKEPSVKEAFAKTGFEIVANTPEEFRAFQAGEIARWKEVVAKGNIPSP
ncbi:Bug family tripartite tricarboxylate transporter substrate binding protein [Chenggangzhangella methanolivorans]|uniref:Tripartite tricarboxylate transporter substrate binding protein n=1 Tax=Chenggangzhangella methanolivorans TaxID=1437009 RepID=A0A9E6UPP4_9HYPH|nr:tripartite tricarboxylate transporter substrate binding protein [Chenggangzhangella methanolivorans]QZO01624.1 tripartite tricarboxylate transporter substrate binding protein [Chenggangzhangella methanolivorans]